MPTYKMVDTDQLEADLTTVADKIRTKGGTSGKMTFPAGFAEAVESISTGVEVLKASGTFTLQNGQRTLSCGFAPDVVVIHKNESVSGFYCTCAVDFAADTRSETMMTSLTAAGESYPLVVLITQTSIGFSVWIGILGTNGTLTDATGTFTYSAVKYTE